MTQERGKQPLVVTQGTQLRQEIERARATGQTIGLVPTMGALHEGHLSLIRYSVRACDVTIATIFVNPTQFGPQEDFSRYPRTWESDLALLAKERVDLLFAPDHDEIYPPGYSTYVEPPAVADPLEGRCRPGHFRGVATIVLKLFQLAPSDVAYFGQKDFQQTRVIQDMVRDFNIPVRIEVCPIVREADGLAMSSRNRYLSNQERERSLSLHRALRQARNMVKQGVRDGRVIREEMEKILQAGGVTQIDYAALVDPLTLQSIEIVTDDTMAVIAAYVGQTRLIDNCCVKSR